MTWTRRLVPPPESAVADTADIIAAHIMPEPPPADRAYVVRIGTGLTHSSMLTLDEAKNEARAWRGTGRDARVCKLIDLTAS